MGEHDDKDLLVGLRDGDKESFRIIFEKNYPLFFSFALRLVGDADTAEDLVQNVFMRLWITRERIDENRSLRNYLLVSVRNEIYCHFRSAYTARRQDEFAGLADKSDHTIDPENEYNAQQLRQSIEQMVDRMPQRRRDIFLMSRQQHLSNSEIAGRLGISVRTVEKHIELALMEIRRKLPVSIVLLVSLLW